MENHIKSADLCNRCIYAFDRHCSEKMQGSCVGCVMDGTGKPGGCKCLTIKDNTPCPYFVEAENNAVDLCGCSACKEPSGEISSYCKNCGAKMDGERI